MQDVIEERQAERRRLDLAWRGAEVRMICQFVAAASGSDELLAAAGGVSLLPDEPGERTGAGGSADGSTGGSAGGSAGGPRVMTVDEARRMFGSAS